MSSRLPCRRSVKQRLAIILGVVALLCSSMAESLSVPAEAIDEQKIFWGTAGNFEKPGSVDYLSIVSATDDYKKAQKAGKDSAKYWIYITKANETAIKAIGAVGSETEYDLIVMKGYLESLNPPIETTDITDLVLAKLSSK